MKYTKLDMYDYNCSSMEITNTICINVPSDKRYIIPDISSELTASGHLAYLEGKYYKVLDVTAHRIANDFELLKLTVEQIKEEDLQW